MYLTELCKCSVSLMPQKYLMPVGDPGQGRFPNIHALILAAVDLFLTLKIKVPFQATDKSLWKDKKKSNEIFT